jgi:hypothetical protein
MINSLLIPARPAVWKKIKLFPALHTNESSSSNNQDSFLFSLSTWSTLPTEDQMSHGVFLMTSIGNEEKQHTCEYCQLRVLKEITKDTVFYFVLFCFVWWLWSLSSGFHAY